MPQKIYNTFQLATPKFKLTPLGGLALDRPFSALALAQAYATASFNIAGNRLSAPIHPVTWFNVKTKKPAVTINMLSDPGADFSTLNVQYAPKLGIDLKKGVKATVSGTGGFVESAYYIHKVPFQIGNLKMYNGLVAIGEGGGADVFGRSSGLNYFDVSYVQGKTVKYTELANAQASLAQAHWRNRV